MYPSHKIKYIIREIRKLVLERTDKQKGRSEKMKRRIDASLDFHTSTVCAHRGRRKEK